VGEILVMLGMVLRGRHDVNLNLARVASQP
jgi:hypothetical protein